MSVHLLVTMNVFEFAGLPVAIFDLKGRCVRSWQHATYTASCIERTGVVGNRRMPLKNPTYHASRASTRRGTHLTPDPRPPSAGTVLGTLVKSACVDATELVASGTAVRLV